MSESLAQRDMRHELERIRPELAQLRADLEVASKRVEIVRVDRDDIRASAARWEDRALRAEAEIERARTRFGALLLAVRTLAERYERMGEGVWSWAVEDDLNELADNAERGQQAGEA